MKNSIKGSIGEPLARYSVQQAAACYSIGHVRYFPVCLPPISDAYNFLVRTPIRVFLDSMERSWSLEYDHMIFNGNWYSHPC